MARNDQAVRPAGTPVGWADPMSEPLEGRWRRWLPLLVWLGCLATAIVLLQWLGDGRLAVPSFGDPGAWRDWMAGTDPVRVTMAMLRLLAVAVAWYLTGVTSISVVARLIEAASLVRLADALAVGPVRVLVQQAVGVGLAASVLAVAVPTTGTATVEDQVAIMTPVAPHDATAVAASGLALRDEVPAPVPAPAPVAVPTPVRSTAPVPAGGAGAQPVADPGTPSLREVAADEVEAPVGQAPRQSLRERRIAAGDHFWAIAEEDVAAQLGRPGTEDEVLDHWETLLVLNADRLVVAGNADLLLPGQTIILPDVMEVAP